MKTLRNYLEEVDNDGLLKNPSFNKLLSVSKEDSEEPGYFFVRAFLTEDDDLYVFTPDKTHEVFARKFTEGFVAMVITGEPTGTKFGNGVIIVNDNDSPIHGKEAIDLVKDSRKIKNLMIGQFVIEKY